MYALIVMFVFAFLFNDDETTNLRPVPVEDIRQQLERFIEREDLSEADREHVMNLLHFRDFTGIDIQGNLVNFSDPELDGYTTPDIVIFGYYAEWCPNCHRNLPALLRLYERYHPEGLNVVLTFMYSDPDRVKEYVKNENVPFPVLIGSEDREVNPEVRLETTHYILRTILEDYRRWGTPFYIIYVNDKPDTWFIVAGEFIEEEIDEFLESHLSSD